MMSGSGREVLPQFWEWSGGTPSGLGAVGSPSTVPELLGRPFRRSGSD